MRYWSLTLHFYQPPTQELEITKRILESCYLPLLRMLSKKSGFGITFNISGSLMLQIKQLKAYDFFDLVKKLIDEGKVEIVNSVIYHPLIPLIPKDVVIRQIEKNNQIIKELLGVKVTEGFFPPELAITNDNLNSIKSKYIFIDESAVQIVDKMHIPIVKYGKRYLLLNNRRICDLMRSYPTQLSLKTVVNVVRENSNEESLTMTVNDAELFGHHYAERLDVLTDLLEVKEITYLKASDAISKFGNQAPVVSDIKVSSWQDCPDFTLWNKNDLQKKYIQLLQVIYELMPNNSDYRTKDLFDQGTSSCYLYWLSNWPWWHPSLVESGATQLITCMRNLSISGKKKMRVEEIYFDFLKEIWGYHWSGKVKAKYKAWNNKLIM